MAKTDWEDELASFIEDIRVIEECKVETPDKFNQFCEFIAESSFESLSEELRRYGIKSKFRKQRGKSIDFEVSFPKSRIDNFHYIIYLPKDSFDLKLKLLIKGRRNIKTPVEEKKEPFMEHIKASEILKLSREELIRDVIKHYKKFSFEALNDLPSFWDKSTLEVKNNLLNLMFPEGFFYDGKKVGTTKIATIFKVFEGNNTEEPAWCERGDLNPHRCYPTRS